jgi:hypothetical protein
MRQARVSHTSLEELKSVYPLHPLFTCGTSIDREAHRERFVCLMIYQQYMHSRIYPCFKPAGMCACMHSCMGTRAERQRLWGTSEVVRVAHAVYCTSQAKPSIFVPQALEAVYLRESHLDAMKNRGLTERHWERFVKHFEVILHNLGPQIPEDKKKAAIANIRATRMYFGPVRPGE